MTDIPVIVWFRDDLRLCDHPALNAALQRRQPVICVYVLEDPREGLRAAGGASRFWLAQSLRMMDSRLRRFGQHLVLRRGSAADIIPALAMQSGANAVFWNRRYDPAGRIIDEQVMKRLQGQGIGGSTCHGGVLVEPHRISTQSGTPMKVFTPFWKRALAMSDPRKPLPAPASMPPACPVTGDRLEDWRLEPDKPDWAEGLRENWTPGEAGARDRFGTFLEQAKGYTATRDRPDLSATSRLSPHLRFGEISPQDIFHATRFATDSGAIPETYCVKFLSEIGWREFSYYLLHHFPDLAARNFQSRFDDFPWRSDAKSLRAWQKGQTGYPFVDAGMRQLWRTGWMHNRVRMVAASFLVKHLLIDWRAGEQWFWDTLVDADPASNPASWQWVAGSGADAAPYFRIFNPVLQGEKFDPLGRYVREWLPELARLPDTFIHLPWTAPPIVLKDAGIALGATYPHPIIDHDAARKRALAALKTIRA